MSDVQVESETTAEPASYAEATDGWREAEDERGRRQWQRYRARLPPLVAGKVDEGGDEAADSRERPAPSAQEERRAVRRSGAGGERRAVAWPGYREVPGGMKEHEGAAKVFAETAAVLGQRR